MARRGAYSTGLLGSTAEDSRRICRPKPPASTRSISPTHTGLLAQGRRRGCDIVRPSVVTVLRWREAGCSRRLDRCLRHRPQHRSRSAWSRALPIRPVAMMALQAAWVVVRWRSRGWAWWASDRLGRHQPASASGRGEPDLVGYTRCGPSFLYASSAFFTLWALISWGCRPSRPCMLLLEDLLHRSRRWREASASARRSPASWSKSTW